jgi:hypothetical protein
MNQRKCAGDAACRVSIIFLFPVVCWVQEFGEITPNLIFLKIGQTQGELDRAA